ncbi:MAG: hypothetical protein IPM21_07285 [Acidobacteria bacterium]|nr:hypothetical protein [Acidobacteriota bacterium]
MANEEKIHPQYEAIQALLGGYLATRRGTNPAGGHIEQDTIAAFVDGNLSEREAGPVISHMGDCGFCLHVSAELIRLDTAFAEIPAMVTETAGEPGKVSEVLSGLFAKIFGTSDGAVFAHHEDEQKEKEEKDTESSDEEEK